MFFFEVDPFCLALQAHLKIAFGETGIKFILLVQKEMQYRIPISTIKTWTGTGHQA